MATRAAALALVVLLVSSGPLVAPAAADGAHPVDATGTAGPKFLETAPPGTGTARVTLAVPYTPAAPSSAAGAAYTQLILKPKAELVPAEGLAGFVAGLSGCASADALSEEAAASDCLALTAAACDGLGATSYCVEPDQPVIGNVRVLFSAGRTALRVALVVQQQAEVGEIVDAIRVHFDNPAWADPVEVSHGFASLTTAEDVLDSVIIRDAAEGEGEAPDTLATRTHLAYQLYAAGYARNGVFLGDQDAAEWSLSDPSVARLNRSEGASVLLEPIKPGATVLTLTLGGLSDTLPLTVEAVEGATLVIRDAPAGQGAVVGDLALTADDLLPLYAALYDEDGNYLSDVDADWSVTGVPAACGAVRDDDAGFAVFDPVVAGVHKCRVHAAFEGLAGSTGVVSVAPGMPVGLEIHQSASGGEPVGDVAMTADESMVLYALRTDSDGNPTPDRDAVEWRVLGGCGDLDATIGASVTFDARRATNGAACRVLATTHAGLMGIVDAIPAGLVLPATPAFGVHGLASTGDIEVLAGAPTGVEIRSAANGGGIEVGSAAYTTDDTPTFYAAGYDADGNYVGDLAAAEWVSSDTTRASLTPAGASTTLDPKAPGTFTVSVAVSGLEAETGTLTVLVGEPAALKLRSASEGEGDEVVGVSLENGASMTMHAAAYDADDNYVADVYADWSQVNACGTLSVLEGYSSVFTAGTSAREGCKVQASFDGLTVQTAPIDIQTVPPATLGIRYANETDVHAIERSAGVPLKLYAAGYNDEGGFIGNMSGAQWSVVSDGEKSCGFVTPESGAFATFIATNTTQPGCRVTATVDEVSATTGVITVRPGFANNMTMSKLPVNITAGLPLPDITVTFFDHYGNRNTTYGQYGGKVRFALADRQATGDNTDTVPLADVAIPAASGAVHTFPSGTVNIKKTGLRTLTLTPVINNSVVLSESARGDSIDVTPAALRDFRFDLPAMTVIAGDEMPADLKVVARDLWTNVKTNFTGVVAFTSTDPTIEPFEHEFDEDAQGEHVFLKGDLLFKTKGARTLTATFEGKSGVKSVTVEAAPLARFAITMPGETFDPVTATNTGVPTARTAGAVFNTEVRALDAYGNVLDNTGTNRYNGAKNLVFTGAGAAHDGTQPTAKGTPATSLAAPFGTAASVTFAQGVGVTNIVLYRQEMATIGVADGAITGTGTPTQVGAAAAFQLGLVVDCDPASKNRGCLVASESVTGPWSPIVGHAAYHMRVAELDEWDNIVGAGTAVWSADTNPPIASSGPEVFWRPADTTPGRLTLGSNSGLVARALEITPSEA